MEHPPDVENLLDEYHTSEESRRVIDWVVDNTSDFTDINIVDDDGTVLFFPIETLKILKEAIRNERQRGN